MFPLKYCGAWCLVYSNNILFPTSTRMNIQYNRVEISPMKDYKVCQINKNHKGVICIQNETHAKIVWSKQVQYEIDTPFLPSLPFYGKEINCKPITLSYTMDETNTYCTFIHGKHEYVFHRTMSNEKKDTILKIFMTQLLFDLIIRHI